MEGEKMTEQLSKLESSIYQYLLDFTAENTYQPSIRDIGRQFKIKSTKTVSDLLRSLANKGYIERDPTRSRGVRLVGFSGVSQAQPVPYYGKIHAGEPALLPDNRTSFITVDRRFMPSENAFFLKVKGDSMIGKAIKDGDYVMIDPGAKPANNDIIAARIGEEATIKSFTVQNGAVTLKPANPTEQGIVISPDDDFGILGVVCGVFRPFIENLTPPLVPASDLPS